MKTKSPELILKQQTLVSWAKILYKNGTITLDKCNKMIIEIERLTS